MHIDTGVTFRVAKCNIGDRCNYVMGSPSTFSRGLEQRTHPDSKRSSPRSQTVQKGQRQLQRRVWILLRKRTCVGRRDVSLVHPNVSGAADRAGDKDIKIGEGTFANVYKGECSAG